MRDGSHASSNGRATAGAALIDPARKLRLRLTYPAFTGRNFTEILCTIDSLQQSDRNKVATPADWKDGEDVILPSVDDTAAGALFSDGWTVKPYSRTVPRQQNG